MSSSLAVSVHVQTSIMSLNHHSAYTVISSATGNGVIMHLRAELGVVVVDRSTVSVNAGHIMLSFGGYPADLPAHIRFLHPLHNFAILSFDPRELSAEVCASASLTGLQQRRCVVCATPVCLLRVLSCKGCAAKVTRCQCMHDQSFIYMSVQCQQSGVAPQGLVAMH